jgi:hypothetical protein
MMLKTPIFEDWRAGFGSFGAQWIYDESRTRVFDTPGPFLFTVSDYPQSFLQFPTRGEFYVQTGLRMIASAGTDGVTPTHVALLPNSALDPMTIDTARLQAELLSGQVVDFGLRRVGTRSSPIEVMQLQNVGDEYDTVFYHVGIFNQISMTNSVFENPDIDFQASVPNDAEWVNGLVKLNQGETSQVNYVFTPHWNNRHQLVEASFTPPHDNSPVTLKGHSVGPEMKINGAVPVESVEYERRVLLDFGDVTQGSIVSKTFEIANISTDPNGGDTTLTDLSFLLDEPQKKIEWLGRDWLYGPAPEISITGDGANGVIPQGESQSITVQFDARDVVTGEYAAQIRIFSDEFSEFGQLFGTEFQPWVGPRFLDLRMNVVPNGDFNGDGIVNTADFVVWLKSLPPGTKHKGGYRGRICRSQTRSKPPRRSARHASGARAINVLFSCTRRNSGRMAVKRSAGSTSWQYCVTTFVRLTEKSGR